MSFLESAVKESLKLKEKYPKDSYNVARELANIDIHLLWNSDKLPSHISRLGSLVEHVYTVFGDEGTDLALTIRQKVSSLKKLDLDAL